MSMLRAIQLAAAIMLPLDGQEYKLDNDDVYPMPIKEKRLTSLSLRSCLLSLQSTPSKIEH
jgi:hypothetical protein